MILFSGLMINKQLFKNFKGASTPSNIASNIAGKCVADPSTLSKFPATCSKIAGNTGTHT